ncbi:hypothetical protein CH063_06145, partial [Colletotrichum higginsianum]
PPSAARVDHHMGEVSSVPWVGSQKDLVRQPMVLRTQVSFIRELSTGSSRLWNPVSSYFSSIRDP